jgi:transposase
MTLLGMAQNFLPCDRDQVMLLPPSVADWLGEGHLARFVIDTVAALDLDAFYGAYRVDGRGRPAHDPAMMVALLLYNYAVGVRSSRAIERRCVEDVACRVIAANETPDHVTISRFRARFSGQLSELFFKVLALCRQAGMVRVGTVAIDSTKLAANASQHANRTYEGLKREAQRILDEAAQTDAREDAQFGERRGDELPEELADARTRAVRVRQLLAEFEARERELKAAREEALARQEEKKARTGTSFKGRQVGSELSQEERKELYETKRNLTDPDSGIVRHRGQLIQGYNVQTAVADGQVILAARVIGVSPDHGQLEPTFEKAKSTIARLEIEDRIELVLADSGYWNTEQIRTIQHDGVRVLIPPIDRNAKREVHPEVQQMRTTLASEEGKQAYRRRAGIVEPVYAQIRHNRGITRILRRGTHAVQAEIDLIATTHNLLKLFRWPALAA